MKPIKRVYVRKVWFPETGVCPECHHEGLLTHQIMAEIMNEEPPPFYFGGNGLFTEEHQKICNTCAIMRKL